MSLEYREMQPDESKETLKLARSVFPFFYRLFLWGFKKAEVAVEDGEITGGAVWHCFKAGRKLFGYIDFGFTAKKSRGKGIGRETYTRALNKMKTAGSDSVGALVLCDNTPSWKLLADNGCVRASWLKMISQFGFAGTVKIWFETAFAFAPGAELWVSGQNERHNKTITAVFAFITANTVMALIQGIYLNRKPDFFTAAFVALLCLLRLMLSWIFSLGAELKLEFRFWKSGMMIPIIVFFLGSIFPLGGDFYPSAPRWNYNSLVKRLGLIGLGGWLASVIAGVFLLYIKYRLPDFVDSFSRAFRWVFIMLIFNCIPFLMESWSGARVWKWNKALFFIMFTISVLILVFLITG